MRDPAPGEPGGVSAPPPPRAETLLEPSELSQQAISAFGGFGAGVPPPPHLKVTKNFAMALVGVRQQDTIVHTSTAIYDRISVMYDLSRC